MNKFKTTAAVLLTMCTIGVVTASAASAVTFLLAEALAAGASITTAQAVDGEGEVELEDSKVLGQKVIILCSGIVDGMVAANGIGETTAFLSLAGVAAGEPLVGPGVTCTNTANCGGTPLVWAKKLPWKTAAELMIDGAETFFVGLVFNGEYESQCTVLGTTVTDECTSPEVAGELTNEAGGVVDGKASDAFQELAGLTLGTCTIGGELSAAVFGLGTGLLTSGVALSVSSE
jgi:hypothetical protein